MNKLLQNLPTIISTQSPCDIKYCDFNSDALRADFFETDGLHPNEAGVKFLVLKHRTILQNASLPYAENEDIKQKVFVNTKQH